MIVAAGALLVAAASATQDIVVDAFRVESLDESEQAAGMASYVAAYRIGMLASTAGALFIVSGFEGFFGLGRHAAWSAGYAVMAMLVLIGIATTLMATEPEKSAPADAVHGRENAMARIVEAAVGAFSEFLSRDWALVALAFVILYKFTDALAGALTAPFVIDLGFSRNEYAAIIKGVGLAATLIGGFAGGFVARACSLPASLWIGGVLQAVADAGVFVAGPCRAQRGLAHLRHHRRELHQRHRHRDLRRLSVRAVPQSAAHRDPVRAVDRARGVRTHLSVVGGGVYRQLRPAGPRFSPSARSPDCRASSCSPSCSSAGISTAWCRPRIWRRRRTKPAIAAGRGGGLPRRYLPVAKAPQKSPFVRIGWLYSTFLKWAFLELGCRASPAMDAILIKIFATALALSEVTTRRRR